MNTVPALPSDNSYRYTGGKPLYPTERYRIARAADYVGDLPLIGSLIGAIRIISSLAIATLTSLALLFNKCCGSEERAQKLRNCIAHTKAEGKRGFQELVPLLIVSLDRKRAEAEQEGKLSCGTAYGRYMYQDPRYPTPNTIWYSAKRHAGDFVRHSGIVCFIKPQYKPQFTVKIDKKL